MRRTRRVMAACAFAALGVGASATAPATAWAQDDLDQITIGGDELPEPVVVRPAEAPRLASALQREVSWLSGESGDADEPDEEDTIGPAYVLQLHAGGEARQRFVLYPLADGGPRIHRPEEQPGDRTTDEGWFYGRLSMPDTLTAAGAPVSGAKPVLPGGGSGGSAEDEDAQAPVGDAASVLATWREGLQLTALTAVGVVTCLATVAWLIRRKV